MTEKVEEQHAKLTQNNSTQLNQIQNVIINEIQQTTQEKSQKIAEENTSSMEQDNSLNKIEQSRQQELTDHQQINENENKESVVELTVVQHDLVRNKNEEIDNQTDEHLMIQTRQRLQEVLKENAAKSMNDLKPAANQDIAFKIKLKKLDHEPIACKSRKIAFH
jgi:hypothetical protein